MTYIITMSKQTIMFKIITTYAIAAGVPVKVHTRSGFPPSVKRNTILILILTADKNKYLK